jgi:hypothetical protein
MTEEQFWTATPKKITLLLDQYVKHQQLLNGIQPEDKNTHDDKAFNELLKL